MLMPRSNICARLPHARLLGRAPVSLRSPLAACALTLLSFALMLLPGCAATSVTGQGGARSHAAKQTPTSTATATPTPTIPAPTQTAAAEWTAARLPGWALAWYDEFDGSTLDASKWNVVSDAPGGYQNCCLRGTLGAWSADDVSVANGTLQLKTERRAYLDKSFTSGAVTTQGKFSYLYGRMDIRAQIGAGDGLWPAFWLLPEDMQGYYAAYEVDMMEALGQDTHTDYMVDWENNHNTYCQYTGPDFAADYHVYSFVWNATSISFSIDGTQRCSFASGMPTVPMYLILNDRIGGAWPVPPDASTHLPQQISIDYIRVYTPLPPRQPHDPTG